MKLVVNPGPDARTPQPETASPQARPPTDIRSIALTVIAVIAVVLLLQVAQTVIIPIVLAVLISYAVDPLVDRMTRWRLPRPIGAAIALAVIVGAGGYLLYGLRWETRAIVEQLPRGARRFRQVLENGRQAPTTAIQQVQQAANELEKAADAAAPKPTAPGIQRVRVDPPPFNIGDYVMWGSMSIATAIGQIVLIVFLTYFLLASGDLYRRKLVKIAGPSLTQKKITLQIMSEIDRQIERFLLVQVFTSTVVAVATWLALHALGVQQAAMLGVLAGVFNSIPYFGPVIVTGLTAFVAFLQFGTIQMTVLVAGTSLVITTLEGWLLTPWLTSRAARMNAVAVFVGLLFWGWLWGAWGMLLAVPMLMILKAVCDHVEDLQPIGELLGD